MAERPRAHCKKHSEYEPLCVKCIKFDEILERSLAVAHPVKAKRRKRTDSDRENGPPQCRDEWARTMVEAAEARRKAAEAEANPETSDKEQEE